MLKSLLLPFILTALASSCLSLAARPEAATGLQEPWGMELDYTDAEKSPGSWTEARKAEVAAGVKEMFEFAWTKYKTYAGGADELDPIACAPRVGADYLDQDTMGRSLLTTIDSLDTLWMHGMKEEFFEAVKVVEEAFCQFETLDTTVSLFETTIRIIGGLLSAHGCLLEDQGPDVADTLLLDIAEAVATAALPAFDSPTGVPWHRVNLARRSADRSSPITSLAAAGTLVFEWTYLSELTGNPVFSDVTHRVWDVMWAVFSPGVKAQSPPTWYDVRDGMWDDQVSQLGANADSAFEVLLKFPLAFPHHPRTKDMISRWQTLRPIIERELFQDANAYWNLPVDILTGKPHTTSLDALSAFYPGSVALGGDVRAAIRSHSAFAAVARRYGGVLPESWDVRHNAIPLAPPSDERVDPDSPPTAASYLLRPELAESTYSLYLTTGDPWYLDVALELVEFLNTTARVDCGFASIADVRARPVNFLNRMPSYFMAETLKYLYLIFDSNHPWNNQRAHVFNTEAHPFLLIGKSKGPVHPTVRISREEAARLRWTRPLYVGAGSVVESALAGQIKATRKKSASDEGGAGSNKLFDPRARRRRGH